MRLSSLGPTEDTHQEFCLRESKVGYLCLSQQTSLPKERQFFIDNLLVRIHFIIEMIKWTGLAPWELVTQKQLSNAVEEVYLAAEDRCR